MTYRTDKVGSHGEPTGQRWLAVPPKAEPLWRATHQLRRFPSLNGDRETEIAIVGGGVSGLTAAVLLARSGKRVAVVERDYIGSGETGNTTAHLTEAVDARYRTVIKEFGEENARLVSASKRAALDLIET